MAHRHFQDKKSGILEQLDVPAAEYTDASPKGSIDEPIRALVDSINKISNLVTTSSCSGRISVYVEGRGKPQASIPDPPSDEQQSTSGKGGGRWAFVSHEPINVSSINSGDMAPTHALFKFQQCASQTPTTTDVSSLHLIHFKFEPMILHILTASSTDAQRVLSAALQAGFRESGATSLESLPLVAVRSSGLMFDCVIGYQTDDDQLVSIVSEQYLSILVALANQRFVTNAQRIKRFAESLEKSFTNSDSKIDRAGRREENRRQGQLRQAQQRANRGEVESTEDSWTELLGDAGHLNGEI